MLITRSTKDNEAETIPSRWLNRLLNLLNGLSGNNGPEAIEKMKGRGTKWLDWAYETKTLLQRNQQNGPLPNHQKTHGPKTICNRDKKTLIRDPYAIYAKHILKN